MPVEVGVIGPSHCCWASRRGRITGARLTDVIRPLSGRPVAS